MMNTRRTFIGVVLLAVEPSAVLGQQSAVARVSALANGKLLLDGAPTTLGELSIAFKKLQAQGGVVWYYRERAQGEPPPEAMAVVKLIVEHRLPVSMSTKPDFSDYVDPSGQSKPRTK